MASHGFSGGPTFPQPPRTIDNDAPAPMRYQIIDAVFGLAHHNQNEPTEAHLHQAIGHCLGVHVAGNPMGSRRTISATNLTGARWERVYDVILRLVPEFHGAGCFPEYRGRVNQVLAANGIAWDLDEHGRLVRVLPAAAQALVADAVQELAAPQFAPAQTLFKAATEAYNAVPRRDRDSCSNAFDAMESVVKQRHAMPDATFGAVLHRIRTNNSHTPALVDVLQGINNLRNQNFGHGMTVPFGLTPAEVDFTYLSCVAGILLFARTP